MFIRIYALPISHMILLAIIGMVIWTVAGRFMNKWWKKINTVLLIISIFIILYVTIFCRSYGAYEVSVIPFISFWKAGMQEELYRTILLNCLMYVPFGLGLAGVLPRDYPLKRCGFIMVLSGASVSLVSEGTQLLMNLGNAEVDDLIFNIFGMMIAVIPLSLERIKIRFSGKNDRTN